MADSLWSDLADAARGDRSLDNISPLLDAIDLGGDPPGEVDGTDLGGRPVRRRSGHFAPVDLRELSFDPVTGRVGLRRGPTSRAMAEAGEPSSWLEFPDPTFDWVRDKYVDNPGEEAIYLTLPSAVLTLAFLRGARLDARGMLVPDPDHPHVRFILPWLTLQVRWVGLGQTDIRLVSATTVPGAVGAEGVYQFCRMEPGYAIIGPGAVFGFAFRTAELYLDGAPAPPGLPAAARGTPAGWTGLYLPDLRIFVSPKGIEGIAASAGVRDLYVGIGLNAGVTAEFDVEVVNRAADPVISLRYLDDAGRSHAIPDGAATAAVPQHGHLVATVGGSVAPYTTTVTVDGTATTGAAVTSAAVDVAAGGSTVRVTATAGGGDPRARTLTLTRAAAPTPGSVTPGPVANTTSTGPTRLRVEASTATSVTVALTDGGSAEWTWDGGGSASGTTATIPVTTGRPVAVTATRTVAAGTADLDIYFRFDQPDVAADGTPGDIPHFQFSDGADNTATEPAADASNGGQWSAGARPVNDNAELRARLQAIVAPGVTVTGFASYDGDPTRASYNQALSVCRAASACRILRRLSGRDDIAFTPVGAGFADSRNHPATPTNMYWRATAAAIPRAGTERITGTVLRTATTGTPPVTAPAGEAATAPPPDWFRKLSVQVKLERSRFVYLRLLGEVDFQTATELALARNTPPQSVPANSMDGVCEMIIEVTVDDAAGRWSVAASIRADSDDRDGLAQMRRPTVGSVLPIDLVGTYAALGPLLAAAAPASPTGGEVVPLVIATASAFALAATDTIKIVKVTLRGAELKVTDSPDGTVVSVMFDVETSFGFEALIVRVPIDRPVTTRNRSVGVQLGWNSAGANELRPVFDPSRGYTIDIPAGSLVGAGPLGDILRVLGTRMSRDNPTYLEVDLGIAADLGIVEVDRARVRVRLDASELPTLTALGAGIDVGVLRGRGYLAIEQPDGLTGALDVTVANPLNLRVSAGVKIQKAPSDPAVLGVFIGMDLDFPVPILLGNTGLGIYGFLGGVGVNMRRDENPGDPLPALDWLLRQDGDPIKPDGWVAEPGHWAFALGALLGTVDAGFILHLKGVVLLEIPGPRLMLIMKADILSLPPALRDNSQQATLLAVVDIDIGAGTITIGLVADYEVIRLVHIRVPVQAYFSVNHPPDWFVDLGTWNDPARVWVFGDLFQGSGYLMLHGNGISIPNPPLPQLAGGGGFTIAVGFHVAFVWGSTDIGLYLRVAGGFDAVISTAPLAVGGIIRIEGELRLFIVSIGARADLHVLSDGALRTYIHGAVCGHVDLFFFEVEGCVDFTLGKEFTPDVLPDDLVTGVQLVSRSPALVEGSGTDRAIDGVLTRAEQAGTADPEPDKVPLDAIPVISFGATPMVAGLTVLGHAPEGSPGTPANVWLQRGHRWWRYHLDSVTLTGPLGAGETPSRWWSRAVAVDPAEGTRLALLTWAATATPRAIPYSEQLTTSVTERWESVCDPPADPAEVLWTFDGQPLGPSRTGWRLTGMAWPDPPGTARSSAPDLRLAVGEVWRCGDDDADRRRGIEAATVIGDAVPCKPDLQDPAEGWSGAAAMTNPGWLAAASSAVAAGANLGTLRDAIRAGGWNPRLADGLCPGRVLRPPWNDGQEPSRFGDPVDAEVVERAWAVTGFTPGPLLDTVTVHSDGGIVRATVLVLVHGAYLDGGLVFRFLDADGNELGVRPIDLDSAVDPVGLPGQWIDPAGPWCDPVGRSVAVANRLRRGDDHYRFALVTLDLPDGVRTIVAGYLAETPNFAPAPPFYLVAMAGLLADEPLRFSWDDAIRSSDRRALSQALSREEDDHALLTPGETYAVTVGWHAEYCDQDTQPAINETGVAAPAKTQTFTFITEEAAHAPSRLDPWVLSTTPGPDEHGIFCDDPLRVVFATPKVADLFAAYGTTLELVLRASSGKHPQPGGPRAASGALSPAIVAAVVEGTGGVRVDTPWEHAAREINFGACVTPELRTDHATMQVRYPLEPCTDYLIDILRRPTTGGGPKTLVFRRGFSTGRFRSLTEFAATFTGARLAHQAVANRAALDALPERPAGDVIDNAFAAAGLDRPTVPRYPRVEVLWTAGAAPQPVAVLVEAAEPLWRTHPVPRWLPTGDPRDQTAHSWRDVPTEYLKLERDPAATAAVTRIVRDPGGQRALVLLPPGQRGTDLVLRLHRDADPLSGGSVADNAVIATMHLGNAPWEDVDG